MNSKIKMQNANLLASSKVGRDSETQPPPAARSFVALSLPPREGDREYPQSATSDRRDRLPSRGASAEPRRGVTPPVPIASGLPPSKGDSRRCTPPGRSDIGRLTDSRPRGNDEVPARGTRHAAPAPDSRRFLDSRLRGNDEVAAPGTRHVALRTPHFGRHFAFCILIFAFLFGFAASAANAQQVRESEMPAAISDRPLPVRFENLSIEDGLAMSVVESIYQDRYGFMWIGTQNGVDRYDGHEFKLYETEAFNSESIPEGWVMEIAEDRDGYVWFATTAGVGRLDRATERFRNWRHDPDDSTTVGGSATWVVQPDSSGYVWVATSGGLDRIDPTSDVVTHFRHDSTRLPVLAQTLWQTSCVTPRVDSGSVRVVV